MRTPEEVFTPEEIENILKLADQLNVDYGELDILRDNEDGKVWVLDVNKTPNSSWWYKVFPHAGHIIAESFFRVRTGRMNSHLLNQFRFYLP